MRVAKRVTCVESKRANQDTTGSPTSSICHTGHLGLIPDMYGFCDLTKWTFSHVYHSFDYSGINNAVESHNRLLRLHIILDLFEHLDFAKLKNLGIRKSNKKVIKVMFF